MSLSTRLAGMFAGAAVVIFALIGTMLYCILDRQTERLQQGEVDVRFNMVSRMLDHPDLAERWPHLQGKLDNLSQEYELIRFWIDSDDPRYHYGRFSEPVQRLIADGAGRYELQLPEHRYALTARVVAVNPETDQLVLLAQVVQLALQVRPALGQVGMVEHPRDHVEAHVHLALLQALGLAGPANAAANITKRSCNPTWRSWSGCGRSSTICCSSPAPTRDAWPASVRKPRWPARSPPRWISSR